MADSTNIHQGWQASQGLQATHCFAKPSTSIGWHSLTPALFLSVCCLSVLQNVTGANTYGDHHHHEHTTGMGTTGMGTAGYAEGQVVEERPVGVGVAEVRPLVLHTLYCVSAKTDRWRLHELCTSAKTARRRL